MIRSFKHKGLQKFFENGTKKGILPGHLSKLGRILDRLDAAVSPNDMNLPGYSLHKLSGYKKETWAVSVSGNWRITFQFTGVDAAQVNYLDYH